MARQYDHRLIEKKWQEKWAAEKLYETLDTAKGKKNFYSLVEFVYPSGDLHAGHWYAFSVPDIFVRMKRMKGFNVLYPMGFDAFGLPAENAAIKNKTDPAEWTKKNIERMRGQLRQMGNAFDWTREVVTADPAYYRWTQWLFLKLYEKGLAYKKKALVNWDPVDKTVLANEQVLSDGTAERSGAKVEKKELEQWFFKITDYADRLIDDLEPLEWPSAVKEAQKNWIGRSEGAEILFPLVFGGEQKKLRYVLLHGFNGDPADLGWLAEKLRLYGHEVTVPPLPNPKNPTEREWVDAALAAAPYDENTVLFGYSLGGTTALKVLEKLDTKIAGLVLAGGFIDVDFLDRKRPFENKFDWEFDAKKIKKNAEHIYFLQDTTDTAVSREQAERLGALFEIPVTYLEAQEPHFSGKEEIGLLNYLTASIVVFTTRPDTLFGATYLVLAPEHSWVTLALEHKTVLKNNSEVEKYVKAASHKSELERQSSKEKTGVKLEGVEALNPATGEKIPLYVADYVLAGYGTGAIMAVPAHDERDEEFAEKFGLSVIPVIEEGKLVRSGDFDGLAVETAKQKVTEAFGRPMKTYKLRDWLISRQRYWGCPIPVVYDPEGKAHAVPEEDLPWLLPTDVDFTPTGEAPLARSKELLARTEKLFGKGWRPETDTMDVFVDSSWYFLRYLDPKNVSEFSALEKQSAWMPVNRYSGGSEHTTVHVLYSRFFYKALSDLGLVTGTEPYETRMNRGIILAEDGRKMSKRWGNVINPDEQVENVGADAVRTYLAFIGPYNESGSFPWSTNGLIGVRRFLERVAGLSEKLADIPVPDGLSILLNQTVKKAEEDIEAMKFNTSVSALMILSNELGKLGKVPKAAFETLLLLLAPFAPYLTEELWHELGHKTSIHLENWPSFDASKLASDTVVVAVQIGGKTRGTVSVPRGASESEVLSVAKDDPTLSKFALEGSHKIIFVPDKVINIISPQ